MANLDEWQTVTGEAFQKGVKPGEPLLGDDDKTNFTVKSDKSGQYVSCTLWKNSHGHIQVCQGDGVRANGKVKKKPKEQGEGYWVNLSISAINVMSMDRGVRDDQPTSNDEGDDDSPDVL